MKPPDDLRQPHDRDEVPVSELRARAVQAAKRAGKEEGAAHAEALERFPLPSSRVGSTAWRELHMGDDKVVPKIRVIVDTDRVANLKKKHGIDSADPVVVASTFRAIVAMIRNLDDRVDKLENLASKSGEHKKTERSNDDV